jgi:hypothetical protein
METERYRLYFLDDAHHAHKTLETAAIILPTLITRCASVIDNVIADLPLLGKIPLPRLRQEELMYALQGLLELRLQEGTYRKAFVRDNQTQRTLCLRLYYRLMTFSPV